jgi:hypothetical protein
VEVFLRERELIPEDLREKIGQISGCLRSPITGSFLPSESSTSEDRFKKTLFIARPENWRVTAKPRDGAVVRQRFA